MNAGNVTRFPVAMKRGPKVRKGPCAQIVAFPDRNLEIAVRLFDVCFKAFSEEHWEAWKARHQPEDRVAHAAFEIVENRHSYTAKGR